jgi:cytochrome c553
MGKIRFWICLCLMGGASLGFAQGDPSAGKEKAETCGGCHGADGNSSAPIFPKLASQHASYLAKQLHEFKTRKRADPTMSALSEPLTDADIDDLSAYYAQQKITIEPGKPSALGEKIYLTGNQSTGVPACTGCHGPGGNGNPRALFPQVNGQYAAYIEKTLKDFKSGARGNDMNGMMRAIAGRLSAEEISAVADYISKLE